MNTTPKIQLDTMTRAYLECALWASSDTMLGREDEEPKPLNENYNVNDFNDATAKRAATDCEKFYCEAEEKDLLSDSHAQNPSSLGHDFWLNRNGHGAGFWEGSYPQHGEALSDLAHAFGLCDAYIGDDNQIHLA